MISLEVNGQKHLLDVAPETPPLYVLRNDLGLNGPKFGCGLGPCGVCAVLMVRQAVDESVATVEIIRTNDPDTIAHYGVRSLPGLVINGTLEASGKFLSAAEVRRLLERGAS